MTGTEKKVVKPGKSITAAKANEIKKKLIKASEQNIKLLVLDLAKVGTMDTIGLGTILAAHNTMKNLDGNLELINVSNEFCAFFETTRLDQHFNIQPM